MARILIVEDDEKSYILCKDLLEKSGHSVLYAKNGKTGLKMIESDKPDMVLLDILLPDMNGLAMLQLIQNNPGIKDIPIVAVTCLGRPEDRVECLSAGCVEHISKPIDTGEFVNKIEKILKKK
jgi:two-component system, cell cycle response regulator DivK